MEKTDISASVKDLGFVIDKNLTCIEQIQSYKKCELQLKNRLH